MRKHNQIRAAQRAVRLPSIPRRQQPRSREKLIGCNNCDIQVAVQIPVLKAIIQEDNLRFEILDRILCSPHAIFIYDNNHAVKFFRKLAWLVARFRGFGTPLSAVADNHITRRRAFVATTDDCNAFVFLSKVPG